MKLATDKANVNDLDMGLELARLSQEDQRRYMEVTQTEKEKAMTETRTPPTFKQKLHKSKAIGIIVRGLAIITYPIWGPYLAWRDSRRKNHYDGPPD